MAVPILGALGKALPYISAACQVVSSYLTKPKKEDYVPTGSMYNRYINYLKSKTTESTVYHQRMRPALRQIGAQTQRGQRQVGYQVARDKPGGGIEAQMRMGINQQALEAIGIASERASIAQERVNVETGEQLLRIGVQEERQLQQYQRAKQQWTKDMFRTGAQVGINLANVAVQKHIADAKMAASVAKDAATAEKAIVKAYEGAKAVGDFVGSLDQFKEGMDIADYTDPTAMGKYLATTKAQQEKDIEFQKDIELENIKRRSADELIRIKQYTDEHPEDALAFIRESKTLQRSMITKDYIEAGEYAADKATKLEPFENEFTSAVLRDSLKDMKNIGDKIYESDAPNKYKLATHRTIQAEKARRIADYERELREADKIEAKRIKAEIKGLKFDADKDTLSLLLGVEAELHTAYREGENEKGIKYSAIGEEALSGVQTTLKGISFNKETEEGMSKSDSVGLKKGIITWAKSIEFDDAQLSDLFRNMSKLAEGVPEIQNYMNTKTVSEIDSRSLTLIKYYLNRIDALYKQIPYDDTSDLVAQTRVP